MLGGLVKAEQFIERNAEIVVDRGEETFGSTLAFDSSVGRGEVFQCGLVIVLF